MCYLMATLVISYTSSHGAIIYEIKANSERSTREHITSYLTTVRLNNAFFLIIIEIVFIFPNSIYFKNHLFKIKP